MSLALFVNGRATITMTGKARFINRYGDIVQDLDLNELGVQMVEIGSVDLSHWSGLNRYRLTFDIDLPDPDSADRRQR